MNNSNDRALHPLGPPTLITPEEKTYRDAQALAQRAHAEGRLASFLYGLIEALDAPQDPNWRILTARLRALQSREGEREPHRSGSSPGAVGGPEL